MVAVKVVEHRIAAGDGAIMSREPLLWWVQCNCCCLLCVHGVGWWLPEPEAAVWQGLIAGTLSGNLESFSCPCPPAPRCSMSVSHPNCISTYKLSAIRLLRCNDLLDNQGSASSILRVSGNTSEETDDSARLSNDSGSGRLQPRRLRSLLSGAEAVEVEDPYGPLQPGLYETWILSEVRGKGEGGRGNWQHFCCP